MEAERANRGCHALGLKRERDQHAEGGGALQGGTAIKFWMRDGYGSQDSSTDVSDSDDDVDFNEEGEAEESARGGVPEDLHRLLKKSHIGRRGKCNEWKKPRIAQTEEDGRSVFVGRLPGNATSQVLRDRFSAFGSVVGVDVRSFKTKRGQRTYAYVEFANPMAAAKAVQASPIRVKGAKVYVGSIRRRRDPPHQNSRKVEFLDQSRSATQEFESLETGAQVKAEGPRTAPTEIFIEDGASALENRGPATGAETLGATASGSAPLSAPSKQSRSQLNVPVTFQEAGQSPNQNHMSPTVLGSSSRAIEVKETVHPTRVPAITPIEEEPAETEAASAAARVPFEAKRTAAPEPKPVNPWAKPGPASFKIVEMQDGTLSVLAPRVDGADADADVIDIPVKGAQEDEPAADMEVQSRGAVAAAGTVRAAALPNAPIILEDETKPETPTDAINGLEAPKDVSKSPRLGTSEEVGAAPEGAKTSGLNPETLPDAPMPEDSDDDMPPLETIPDARPRAAGASALAAERAPAANAFEMGATSAAGALSHRRNRRGKEAKERPPKVPYYRNYIRPRKAPIYTHMVVAAFGFFREHVAAAGGRELARELLEWLVSPEVLETASRDPTALQLLFGDTRWIATGLTGLPPPAGNAQLAALEERYRCSTAERVAIDKIHRDSFAERVERFCELCGVTRYKDPVWSFTGGV